MRLSSFLCNRRLAALELSPEQRVLAWRDSNSKQSTQHLHLIIELPKTVDEVRYSGIVVVLAWGGDRGATRMSTLPRPQSGRGVGFFREQAFGSTCREPQDGGRAVSWHTARHVHMLHMRQIAVHSSYISGSAGGRRPSIVQESCVQCERRAVDDLLKEGSPLWVGCGPSSSSVV